jgi:hypothetical protein
MANFDNNSQKGCLTPAMLIFMVLCVLFWGSIFTSLVAQTPIDTTEVLPVELVEFKTEIQDGRILIEWETAEEVNSDRFELEFSTDGRNYQTEITVPSNEYASRYGVTYLKPYPGNNYIRLVHYDKDGKFQMFPPTVEYYDGFYIVYDLQGHFIGNFMYLDWLNKNQIYIINGRKVTLF